MNLKASRSMRGYEHNINRLRKLFPTPITTAVDGKPKQEYVDSYLRSIHPTNWTVVGNSTLSGEESKWLGGNWNVTSTYGDGMPLFGVRSTSGAEGDNNGLLWKRARSLSVFRALRAYCLRAVRSCRSLVTETDKWVAADCDITPHAKRLFDDDMSHVAKLTVVPSKMPCVYVFDPFDRSDVASATTMYETNMSSGTCRPCKVAQQLQIPCRHIQAVIYSLEQQNKGRPPVYDVLRYFHPAYLVRTIHEAYGSVEIKLPVDTISTSSSNVLPAPLYRQAGGSRKVKTADIQRGQKRIQSRGEEPKASRTRHAGSRGSVTVALVADEHDETPVINVFFESQLSAPSRKERADYHCTNCGLVGHNATLCTFTVHDVEEAGSAICPGLYVLGEPPLKSCGVSATGTGEASEADIN
ncbi:hypothetical protein PR003_g1481 [Phytophthora rubi]|uniref:SWIM-type domain-containing protein n=1 Tax=Phytophthora rubi TaxID=129364 RepID=A0A6A4FVK3_9STRA|nr:hypothetical protein PR001_g1182 [Phytophthora rubi]KAE9358068.1 hypothetical protein PR003_g1481 [Phytophthora rubi]